MTSLNNHSDVKALVDGILPSLSPEERFITRGISWLETQNSLGWGSDPALGAGSNNMGAVTDPTYHAVDVTQTPTPPNAQQFLHVDSRPDASVPGGVRRYVTAFKKYPTPSDGFADVAMVALKPNVRAAVATGVIRNVSKAMHDNVYYTGVLPTADQNIDAHAKRLFDSMKMIASATGEPFPFVLGVAAAPSLPVSPSPSLATLHYDLPVLRKGMTSAAVAVWQFMLGLSQDIDITGVFDLKTENATKAFQSEEKLTADGVVGPITYRKFLEVWSELHT